MLLESFNQLALIGGECCQVCGEGNILTLAKFPIRSPKADDIIWDMTRTGKKWRDAAEDRVAAFFVRKGLPIPPQNS